MKSERGYQHNFSRENQAMHDVSGRTRKAVTMIAVLRRHFSVPLRQMRALDVGASTGIIDAYLAEHFGSVTGIDIDGPAISKALESYPKEHLYFHVGDAMAIAAPDASFDVVICAQVYEHVPDAKQMMGEIFRVLRPGGVCYFAASNRLRWNEPHHNLPLLSVIPRRLAHWYVRLLGRSTYYHELHLSYWGLRALVAPFRIVDYTATVIGRPEEFGTSYMIRPGTLKAKLAPWIVHYWYWAVPGYIWLLQKPGEFVAQADPEGDVWSPSPGMPQ